MALIQKCSTPGFLPELAGIVSALALLVALGIPSALALKAPTAEDVLSRGAAGQQQTEPQQPEEKDQAPSQSGAESPDQTPQPVTTPSSPTPGSLPAQPSQAEEDSWEEETAPDKFAHPETEAEAVAQAEKAALRWLKMVDMGRYAESWDRTTQLFRYAVNKEEWERQLKAARAPMGRLIKRKRANAQYTEYLAGAPDGTYVVFQFATAFARKSKGVETVTMQLEDDGVWRIGGYYIR